MSSWLRVLLPLVVATAGGAQEPREDNGRVFWIGSDGPEGFTAEQVDYLVSTASSIVFAQFHASFDINAHHALARAIKGRDPSVRVFGYMSGTYIKPRFEWSVGKIKDAWILRDASGNRIVHKFRPNGEVGAYFADLTKPDYRAFLGRVAAQWMAIAPYDGIIFDASNYLHRDVARTFLNAVPPHPRERTRFATLLTQEKMDAVNAGLEDLFRETKASIGDQLLVWNGFWRKDHTINRSLALMPLGDVALAERWSIVHPTDPSQKYHEVLTRDEILEDLRIVQQGLLDGKSFFLKDTFDSIWYETAEPDALARLARFGWAMYMMIREPGRVSYGVSPGPRYSLNTRSDPVLLAPADYGAPLGPFVDLGDVLVRSFEHGLVYMNPTPDPVDVVLPVSMWRMRGDGLPAHVNGGEIITIPGRDGVFLGTLSRIASWPPGVAPYGISTPGCTGPLFLGVLSSSRLGNSEFSLIAANAPPRTPGAFVLSGDNHTTPLELAGARVWVDFSSSFLGTFRAATDALGVAERPFPLPPDPSLVGFRFFAQFAAPDACAPGGVSSSNGLSITLY